MSRFSGEHYTALLSAPSYQCADSTVPSRTDEKNKSGHNSPEKDAAPEWGLVIVGLVTLGFVAWQAYETRRSVQAAGNNMELFIDKERARLRIDFKDLTLKRDDNLPIYTIDFKVSVFGSTAAFVTDSKCAGYAFPQEFIAQEDTATSMMVSIQGLPKVIAAGSQPLHLFTIFQNDREGDSEMIMNEIRADRYFVGVRGFIKYKDVFDRERETRFRYVWKYLPYSPPEGAERWGNWEKCGQDEDNRET